MTRSPWLAWLLLLVWSIWAHALQGLLASGLGAWAPDLGLVLLGSLAARLSTGLLPGVALAIALGRAALSIDPLQAVLAAELGAVLWLRVLRAAIELRTQIVFAPAVGVAAGAVSLWLAFVHESRELLDPGLPPGAIAAALCTSISTALAALVLGPWVAYLPGLSPLRRSSPWSRVASAR